MNEDKFSSEHTPTPVLVLINIVIAFIWTVFVDLTDLFDFVIGLVVGAILIALVERGYGKRAYKAVGFCFYVGWAIVVSNFQLAWIIVQPGERMRERLDPGIVSIPLDVRTGMEITILATVISLTPGTLSVDLGTDDQGREVLYVHGLRVGDPEQFRQQIKTNFEQRLIGFTQG